MKKVHMCVRGQVARMVERRRQKEEVMLKGKNKKIN